MTKERWKARKHNNKKKISILYVYTSTVAKFFVPPSSAHASTAKSKIFLPKKSHTDSKMAPDAFTRPKSHDIFGAFFANFFPLWVHIIITVQRSK